jgi:hypothetical protein
MEPCIANLEKISDMTYFICDGLSFLLTDEKDPEKIFGGGRP